MELVERDEDTDALLKERLYTKLHNNLKRDFEIRLEKSIKEKLIVMLGGDNNSEIFQNKLQNHINMCVEKKMKNKIISKFKENLKEKLEEKLEKKVQEKLDKKLDRLKKSNWSGDYEKLKQRLYDCSKDKLNKKLEEKFGKLKEQFKVDLESRLDWDLKENEFEKNM